QVLAAGRPVARQRVGIEQPAHALGVAHGVLGGDRATPVLRDEGDVAEPEPVHPARQVLDVGTERVVAVLWRLALPEAHVVWREDTPALGEPRDHAAIEVAPGRLAVQADDGLRARRALVDVLQPEGPRGAGGWHLVEAGRVWPRGVEGLVGGNHGAIRYTAGAPLPAVHLPCDSGVRASKVRSCRSGPGWRR